MDPNHYDVGWHITGTAGVFGAAGSCRPVCSIYTEQQMIWAWGLAASQPVGLRESFGSMTRASTPAGASNGLFAAILASKNYTSSDCRPSEAKRGWAKTVTSASRTW